MQAKQVQEIELEHQLEVQEQPLGEKRLGQQEKEEDENERIEDKGGG